MAIEQSCESCAATGRERPATTRTINPDYSRYELCAECAEEYDERHKLSIKAHSQPDES